MQGQGYWSNRWRVLLAAWVLLGACGTAGAWWDKAWPIRAKVTLDPGAAGIAGTPGTPAVLVRLHEGNFQFLAATENGADIRFVAEDDKTLLPFEIEKYDGLLNEAFVWVKAPELKPGEPLSFWMYYGNAEAPAPEQSGGVFDAETVAAYHFAGQNAPPRDSSPAGNDAANAGGASPGALIGPGLRLDGRTPVAIPGSDSLKWAAGGELTWSAWIKPAASAPGAVLFSRREGDNGFVVGVDNGLPYVEIGGRDAAAPEAVAANTWTHLAVTVSGAETTLYVNGKSAAVLNAGLPALAGEAQIGGGFIGEIDELRIATAARPEAAIRFAALAEGGSAEAGKLVQISEDAESGQGGGRSAALEHVLLFGDIARNMMFDGWIAVGICVLMMIFGWGVAVRKFNYLNSIQKGSDAFLHQWHHVARDLTALDHQDEESVKSLGGKADAKTLRLIRRSPLYHIYHIGSTEIAHRLGAGSERGLSARSIQAIRASLESGLVRENQRMNSGLIFLTISIAGGPYVGLLGTVVGVMITFAIIAKSGEVDVNSIAPGIASALLATVFGLLVAIPALFIYSYLSLRIKDLLASMQVFIDEFIAKMAEFYPAPGEAGAPPVTEPPENPVIEEPAEAIIEASEGN